MVPFTPDNIHARFPTAEGVSTATGRGWTWVADERPGGFKTLYTCFEARHPEREVAGSGGVPSGGGWHYIGDAAETIINDLEPGPIVVGAATTFPLAPSALASGSFAWGLSDVATIRWLYPGEAFVTVPTIFRDRDQDHQWYAIPVGPRARGFLAEEWVSPTRPAQRLPRPSLSPRAPESR